MPQKEKIIWYEEMQAKLIMKAQVGISVWKLDEPQCKNKFLGQTVITHMSLLIKYLSVQSGKQREISQCYQKLRFQCPAGI